MITKIKIYFMGKKLNRAWKRYDKTHNPKDKERANAIFRDYEKLWK